jgi:tetratricopeptide (TPR) repeat protein
MNDASRRLKLLEAKVEDLSSDIEMLRALLDRDHQSALNKMRYVTEKVLHRLCQQHAVTWGSGEPTLENMIGPLLAKRVIPKSVAIHVRTVQTNTSPGSHYQESPLGATHVLVAQMALVDFLEWYHGGAESSPATSKDSAPALPSMTDVSASRKSRVPLIAAGAVVSVAVVGGIIWFASKRDAALSAAPAKESAGSNVAATTGSAAMPAVAATKPALGEKTLDEFRKPTASTAQNLRSRTLWNAVARDFASACAADGMPKWCAGADFARGQEALLRGNPTEAVKLFDAAIARDATSPEWHVGLSMACLQQRDLAPALAAAEKAQGLDPTWWVAVAVGARAYATVGKFDEAIQEYRRAESLAPDNGVLLSEIALMHHAARMDTEADRYAKRALEIDENLTLVRLMLAERALERGDAKTALAEADRAVAHVPKLVPYRLARADALLALHRDEEAAEEFDKVLELSKESEEGQEATGRLSVVKEARAAGKLPPPRVPPKSTSASKAASSKKAPGRPSLNPKSERSRPACNCPPGDPLCSCL